MIEAHPDNAFPDSERSLGISERRLTKASRNVPHNNQKERRTTNEVWSFKYVSPTTTPPDLDPPNF
jgi:hypothetical protein